MYTMSVDILRLVLTNVRNTVVSEASGRGELLTVPQREDEGGALVRAQHHCVLPQLKNGTVRLHSLGWLADWLGGPDKTGGLIGW